MPHKDDDYLTYVSRLVRKAGASMSDSLYYYWPTDADSDVAERNITVHLGHSFLDAGFLTYGEVPSDSGRLDLAAMHPRDGVPVLCEFKRGMGTQIWRADLKKIRRWKPSPAHLKDLNVPYRVGVLASIVEYEDAKWFMTEGDGKKHTKLGDLTQWYDDFTPNGHTGAVHLIEYERVPGSMEFKHQWLAYIVFRVEEKA